MFFKGNRKATSLPNMKMNDINICCIQKSTFLGVIIDDKITWIHLIEHMSKKSIKINWNMV